MSEARRTGPGAAVQIDHLHQELEFNLVIAGKGAYFLSDRHYDLVPGTLIWLLPGQSHRLMRSPDFDMWVATIHPGRLDGTILDQVAERRCCILSTEDAIAMDRLLSHICQDSDEPRLYDAGLEYAFRSAWHVTMTGSGPAERPLHPAARQVLEILRTTTEMPSAGQLAKRCGVSQKYLGQLLMEHTGRGLVEWRNRTRLEHFHKLYPKSEDLLTAALEAGFGSYTQFHRVFSELIGSTPGEWAKKRNRVESLSAPSIAASITGSNADSVRMAWYSLSELPLPYASQWFDDRLADRILSAGRDSPAATPIATEVSDVADFRRFESEIIDEVRSIDVGQSDRLARIFARNDVFRQYKGTFGLYGLGVDDLSVIIGIYLGFAYATAHKLPIPSTFWMQGLSTCVGHALRLEGTFEGVSTEERQKVAARLICQSMFLRHSSVAAKASGLQDNAERIAAAARTTALATLKCDVNNMSFLE